MKRKISALLSLVMLLVCFPFSVFAEGEAVDVWDGSVATSFESGNGTKQYPFVIVNAAQLALLAEKVNSATNDTAIESDWGGGLYACNCEYYELGADIALNDTSKENWKNNAREWPVIGTKLIAFAGHFDGKGFEISGLYVNSDDDLVGLFSIVSDKNIGEAEVSNLSVVDSYVKGANHVGGIVGTVGYCRINECSFGGKVEGVKNIGGIAGSSYGNIFGCKNNGTIHGEDTVGGIVGLANNIGSAWSISQCVNHGTVEATRLRSGGIVGFANYDPDKTEKVSYISDCFNIGEIIIGTNFGGGIVGAADAKVKDATVIRNCYSIGEGNLGENFSAICNAASDFVKFEYCYYLKNGKLGAYIRNFSGLILNSVNPDGVYPLSETDIHSPTAYAGFDFDDTWGFIDGYPVLRKTHDHDFTGYDPSEDGHIAHCDCGADIPQEHTLGDFEVITPPECGVEGERGKKCTFCGDYCEREPIAALECELGDFEVITPPECDVEGQRGRKCKLCGEYSELEAIPALECELGEVEIIEEPTCQSEGKTGRKCSLCGEYSDIETIEMLKCLIGDVDHSENIDVEDYIILKRVHFGTANVKNYPHPETADYRCDVNRDGTIDADDYILVKRAHFGTYTIKQDR